MIVGVVVVASLVVGFMAGLLTFKRSEQWCREHGTTKACLLCERPLPQAAPPIKRHTV
ncbi:MAG: hypothetical protein QOC94_2102 [Actinoplanes sp.]|jgi:hypothetical protein|nr:hypothetical protein [Actinoplanes sp.]